MRKLLTLSTIVVVIALGTAYAKDEPVESLKSRVDHAQAQDRPKLCVQVAEMQLRNADHFYNAGNIEQAQAAVADIVSYSEKARDSAKETKKQLKHVEISVRKMADKLTDIKRTLSFDDQPPVDLAIQRLQEIRTSLLDEMFKKDKK